MEKFNPAPLRKLIKKCGFTIDELATRTGIKRATLYNYLNGTTPITVEAIYRLSKILELNNSKIFDENVLMNVLMNVPPDVLTSSPNEQKKDCEPGKECTRYVIKDQMYQEVKKENAALNQAIGKLNYKVEQLEEENGKLRAENAVLKDESKDSNKQHRSAS